MTMTTRLTLTLLALCWCAQLMASTCFKTTEQKDLWVRRNVDRLITKARAAYEDETAQRAYVRTLNYITDTLKQCQLTEDPHFISRYSDFAEWIRVLSLDQQSDHEQGRPHLGRHRHRGPTAGRSAEGHCRAAPARYRGRAQCLRRYCFPGRRD